MREVSQTREVQSSCVCMVPAHYITPYLRGWRVFNDTVGGCEPFVRGKKDTRTRCLGSDIVPFLEWSRWRNVTGWFCLHKVGNIRDGSDLMHPVNFHCRGRVIFDSSSHGLVHNRGVVCVLYRNSETEFYENLVRICSTNSCERISDGSTTVVSTHRCFVNDLLLFL